MRNTLRKVAIGLASLLGGGLVGYFLYAPFLAIPVESGAPILGPLLRPIHAHASNIGAEYVAPALAAFLLHLPNTVFLAGVSALALRTVPVAKRLAFYSVFLVPVFVYADYWFQVWRLTQAAERLGLQTSIDRLPTDLGIGFKVVLMLLTYGLFAVLVFCLLKLKVRRAVTHA